MKTLLRCGLVVVFSGMALLSGCATSKPPVQILDPRVSALQSEVQRLEREKADKKALEALEERIESLEEWREKVVDPLLKIRGEEIEGVRKGVLTSNEMINLSLEPGMVLRDLRISGFELCSWDLAAVLDPDAKAEYRLNVVERRRAFSKKVKVLAIVAFEDTSKCPEDAKVGPVAFNRGAAMAKRLRVSSKLVDVRAPTDQWGPPEKNRGVLVFYKMPAELERIN